MCKKSVGLGLSSNRMVENNCINVENNKKKTFDFRNTILNKVL